MRSQLVTLLNAFAFITPVLANPMPAKADPCKTTKPTSSPSTGAPFYLSYTNTSVDVDRQYLTGAPCGPDDDGGLGHSFVWAGDPNIGIEFTLDTSGLLHVAACPNLVAKTFSGTSPVYFLDEKE
jgi:hypothetical protein